MSYLQNGCLSFYKKFNALKFEIKIDELKNLK